MAAYDQSPKLKFFNVAERSPYAAPWFSFVARFVDIRCGIPQHGSAFTHSHACSRISSDSPSIARAHSLADVVHGQSPRVATRIGFIYSTDANVEFADVDEMAAMRAAAAYDRADSGRVRPSFALAPVEIAISGAWRLRSLRAADVRMSLRGHWQPASRIRKPVGGEILSRPSFSVAI